MALLLHFLLLFTPQSLARGLQEMQQGDLRSAEVDLQKASELDPKNAYVWAALAEVYWREHQPERAQSAASKAEQNAGDNPTVAHALAMFYAQSGDWSKAAQHEQLYAASPKADPSANARAAEWFLLAKVPEKALPLANEAAEANPQIAFELAQAFLRLERFNDAADILSTSLQTFPNDPQLVLALGVARYGQRRFDDAILGFLKVIQLDPTIEQPYLFISKMLDQAGQHLTEITKDAEAWAHANPDNAHAQLFLAEALLTADPADKRAPDLLRKAIQLAPNDWQAHYQLGVYLEGVHDYPGALQELKQATVLAPDQAIPHYHLARVYDRLNQPEAAAQERAIHAKLSSESRVAQPQAK